MASQAELQVQLNGINAAIKVLELELAKASPGSAARQQLATEISRLQQQRNATQTNINNLTVQNNPPNPQVPPDEVPLRIDIVGVGNLVSDDITRVDVDSEASGVVLVDAVPPRPGISGPVPGISPYGEADDQFDPDAVQATRVQNPSPAPVDTFTTSFNVETGQYDVVNLQTGEVVATNLSQQQAILFAQDANTVGVDGAAGEEVNRQIDFAEAQAANIAAQTDQARAQQAIAEWRRQANAGDWRVKLRLAPNANYLYKDPEIQSGSILWPLSVTGGVIFPYTPQINTVYKANYSNYDLTHSNYRGWFYQNSYVDDIQITATFTAQDTSEANYLLAVIHFFRSVTKMFYGQDPQRGAPPPLVFLQGLGQYQFNLQPCLVSQFNYNLPADVDYIRAGSRNVNGVNFLARRDRQASSSNIFSSAWERLRNSGLAPGAERKLPGSYDLGPTPPTLGTDSPTYVPTKLEIVLVLHPVQNRQQVSQEFSLKGFANGTLLRDPQSKGSFW